MKFVEQFTVGGVAYNVARASAIQQDEVLSMLTSAIVECLQRINPNDLDDDDIMFNFFTRMPIEAKNKFDSLMMFKVFKNGTDQQVTAKDFDGAVLELNKLRGLVLKWNLEPFFTYWASELKKAQDNLEKKVSQTV